MLPTTPVMIITAFGTIEKAVEAMKFGAHDFITKPFSPDLLRVKVQQAVEIAKLSHEKERLFFENQYLRMQAQARYDSGEILGSSAAIEGVHALIKKVSRSDSTVFVAGESGTGKELVARAIHNNSPRKDQPFIKVNCSALAEGVLESELFGHEKGAFTGALKRKLGRFELAHQGTLFLDEIGDINANIQVKLLRVLQEKEFERVGGNQTLKVDVRIISATNQDLKSRVDQGFFREDLYYRLVILPILLPPLRERTEDIEALAEAFLARHNKRHKDGHKSFTKDALNALKSYSWPGNVRELQNVVEQLVVMTDQECIEAANLPNFLKKSDIDDKISIRIGELSLPELLESAEKRLIEEAKLQCKGVKTRMAKLLGIKTSALYYKLEKYGLLDSVKE
jgi:two-component system response regulator HydG